MANHSKYLLCVQKMTHFGIGTAGFIQLVRMAACDGCKTQLKKIIPCYINNSKNNLVTPQ